MANGRSRERTSDGAAQEMNDEQARAVRAPIGPTVVAAGPGSGKTLVTTRRVVWMIRDMDIDPETIVVFTFTNRAARELRRRIRGSLTQDEADSLFVGTFHTWGANFLKTWGDLGGIEPDFTIYDVDDSLEAVEAAMAAAEDEDAGRAGAARQHLRRIASWKTKGEEPETLIQPWRSIIRAGRVPQHVKRIQVYREYNRILRQSNGVDFEDLIAVPLRILTDHPDVLDEVQEDIEHVLVDEYQDTSRSQHLLVTTLANREDEEFPSIFVVGDSDQAIYGFRDADVRNINLFRVEAYPNGKEIQLQNNYRSSGHIVSAAQALIVHNSNRINRDSKPVQGQGERLEWLEADTPEQEAAAIAGEIRNKMDAGTASPDEFCVLYRTNPQSRALEEALRAERVPYQVTGNMDFYKRAEIRRHLDYLKLAINPRDRATLKRIINVPSRGIGPKTMGQIETYASEEEIHIRTAVARLAGERRHGISTTAREGLAGLHEMLTKLERIRKRKTGRVVEAVKLVTNEGGLRAHFANMKDGGQREANMNELEALAEQFDGTIEQFIDRAAVNQERTSIGEDRGQVTLSTIHQAKGLEFARVYIAGVQEGLMPLYREEEQRDADLEEERRLMYVAMTRAERNLTLTWSKARHGQGGETLIETPRSAFIEEIPADMWATPLPE